MNKTISILHTSDIHGYILANDYTSDQTQPIGLARVGTAIKAINKHPLIRIDTGDTIQGSPLSYIHQKYLRQSINPLAKVFNHLKFEYFIPGNHDFNHGKDYLKDFMKSFNGTSLCANIYEGNDLFAQKPYVIHQSNEGIKIGIIGLTTDYIPHWESPSNIDNLTFKPVIDTLRIMLNDIKKHHPHAIVVAYHGGFEKDLDTFKFSVKDTKENVGSAMIESFPEIDILLTGHQHRMISRNIRNVSVSQPGSRASLFSLIQLEFVKNEDWVLTNVKNSLNSSEDYQVDKAISTLIEKEENFTQNKLNEVIGHVKKGSYLIEDQIQARIHKHPIVSLLNHIQMSISGAMISCVSLANEAKGFNQAITIRDVFATYPYPNTLSLVKISGRELRLALEENAQFFIIREGQITIDPKFVHPKKQLYNYDMFDGIEYTINVSQPIGQRITKLTRNHQPVLDSDTFTMVLNNYRVAGGGDFEIFRNLEVIKDIPNDVALIIIDYIQQEKEINYLDHKNIKITM